MKKLMACAVAMAVLSMPALAQTETLFDSSITTGGYGGPSLKVTGLHGQAALMMGASGAVIINKAFHIGIAGYGLVTDVALKRADTNWLGFAYGGLLLGYQIKPDKVVHLGAQLVIGAGGIGHRRYWGDDGLGWSADMEGGQPVFVVEPGLTAELNISHLIRLQLEGSYRFVTGNGTMNEKLGVTEDELSLPAATLTLKFGSF